MARSRTLLVIEVNRIGQIAADHGTELTNDVLRHVVRHTRSALSGSDSMYRRATGEFVALLRNADTQTATAIAERIQHRISEESVSRFLTVSAEIAVIETSGFDIDELVETALSQLRANRTEFDGSIVH